MDEYLYTRFITNNPDAVILAERKLDERLEKHDAMMRIYSYNWDGRYGYMFRYEERMVMNPLIFDMPIPRKFITLFCYEWFLEYERKSGVKEMFENDEEFFSTPSHMNMWEFARKWEVRMGHYYGYNEGEIKKEYRKNQVLKHLQELKKNASKEEWADLKKEMEAIVHDL